MRGRDAQSTGVATAAATPSAAAQSAAGPLSIRHVHAARAGRFPASDAPALQSMVGNRSFTRLLARAGDEHRPMQGPGPNDPKPDPVLDSPSGHRFVWDPFDHTVTIYMPPGQPNAGGAVQLTYAEATAAGNATLPNMGMQNAISLSPRRAQILEELRVLQGTYQESEEERKHRVAAGTGTLCYAFTSAVTSVLEQGAESKAARHIAGMDPRQEAIAAGRGGAFHTLEDRPEGPKPGDVISYGVVKDAPAGGQRRRANFEERSHIGIFKSKRRSGADWIWTVVDGGQGKRGERQAIWERTRLYTEEQLDVQIPRTFAQSDIYDPTSKRLKTLKGGVTNYEAGFVTKKCGVLKSKLNDTGQEGDKLLRGWMDIDEFYGSAAAGTLSLAGVNADVFVGSSERARANAASAGTLAKSP